MRGREKEQKNDRSDHEQRDSNKNPSTYSKGQYQKLKEITDKLSAIEKELLSKKSELNQKEGSIQKLNIVQRKNVKQNEITSDDNYKIKIAQKQLKRSQKELFKKMKEIEELQLQFKEKKNEFDGKEISNKTKNEEINTLKKQLIGIKKDLEKRRQLVGNFKNELNNIKYKIKKIKNLEKTYNIAKQRKIKQKEKEKYDQKQQQIDDIFQKDIVKEINTAVGVHGTIDRYIFKLIQLYFMEQLFWKQNQDIHFLFPMLQIGGIAAGLIVKRL